MSFKQIIERATSESLLSEDWEANLLLSDLLCQRPDEISAAVVQALLNRLQHPNPKVQLLTLTLYDACVKNTTDLFVSYAAKPQNLVVVEQLAAQKKNEEVSVRATEILGEWEKEQGKKYPQFRSSYAKVTGRAPVSQAAPVAPAPAPAPVSRPAPQAAPSPARSSERSKLPMKEKIRHDLQAVKDQTSMLVELVNAASSVEELKSEAGLQVIVNCREMHRRLVILIEKVPEETLLLELIAINEDLFNAIDYYDQFKRTGKKPKPPTTSSQAQSETHPQAEKKPSSVVDDVFGPPPAASKPAATAGVFSLDDLLSAPVVSPVTGASTASTASSAGAVPLIPPPSYPNPFDYSQDSLQQEFETISKRQEKQPVRPATNPFEDLQSPSTEAGFAALAKRKKEEQEEDLGFAAIAKKKTVTSNPTNEFEQFLNSKIASPPAQTQQPQQQSSSDVFTLE